MLVPDYLSAAASKPSGIPDGGVAHPRHDSAMSAVCALSSGHPTGAHADPGNQTLEPEANVILAVENLKTYFHSHGGIAKSVDGVDFAIRRGETLAVVGESGSGKSVTSLSIMRLIPSPPGFIAGGRILFRDRANKLHNLLDLPMSAMRRIRGREIAMIFQEPMSSLNPVYTVGEQIAESLMLHEGKSRADALLEATRMLELVEIPAAKKRVHEYPHQMSGGMRQRIMIALALACRPALLIADEPTTALDVTIQAQILDLMRKLQKELGMSMLFITHNLGVVAEIADEVAVMYAGRVVEHARVEELFARPRHPYTKALLSCTPRLDQGHGDHGRTTRLPSIPGATPPATALPAGCAFAPRCTYVKEDCQGILPPLAVVTPTHHSRCLHWQSLRTCSRSVARGHQPVADGAEEPECTQVHEDSEHRPTPDHGLAVRS